jgi:hypothetical protein
MLFRYVMRLYAKFQWSQNVEGPDTGYRKQRNTVCLFVSLEAKMSLPFVIFRVRKKAPKEPGSNMQVAITSSKSRSMDTRLDYEWSQKIIAEVVLV